MKINISNHAYFERYLIFDGDLNRSKLASKIERHLFAALRQGARLQSGAIHLRISFELIAVLVPGKHGGWDVVTFLHREKIKGAVK